MDDDNEFSRVVSTAGGAQDAADEVRPVLKKNKVLVCDDRHIRTLRRELRRAGLSLQDTTSTTQCQMLIRILKHLGNRGLGTLEAVGIGIYRVATRIEELEAAGFVFASIRESVIGSEGLLHAGMARYVLLDKRSASRQLSLDLEDA